MKIHKIYKKQPSDSWTIRLYGPDRLNANTNFDLRDSKKRLSDLSDDELKLYHTLSKPYQNITINYPGYIGFDREYLNDNTLDIILSFNTDLNAVDFAKQYIKTINDETNPVVSNFMNWVNTDNNIPKYIITYKVEDNEGNITEI